MGDPIGLKYGYILVPTFSIGNPGIDLYLSSFIGYAWGVMPISRLGCIGSQTEKVMGSSEKKKKGVQHVSFISTRRFGVELELNSFDGENRPPKGDQPIGMHEIAQVVAEASPDDGCEIRSWEHTHNNRRWVAKPDSSCGLELCSPPRKGWKGLKDILTVVRALRKDDRINSDSRCSVHVHIEVADLNETQIAAIVEWWVKCEPVIMDAMPMSRKRNRYCQLIGMNNTFQHNRQYSDQEIIQGVGDVKYYSMNTNQYTQGGRRTLEFRTIEGAGCQDAYLVKQWIRLIVHFVETAAAIGRHKPYHEPKNDTDRFEITPWTGLAWMDPEHVFTFLGFNNASIPALRKQSEFTLSKGMQQTSNWFVARMVKYMSRHKPGGMRHYAFKQLTEFVERSERNGLKIEPDIHLSPTELEDERIFGDDTRL